MKPLLKAAVLVLVIALITGCSQTGDTRNANDADSSINGVNAFQIPVPTAPGVNVESKDKATIDYSNNQDGYVIVQYNEITDKALRVIVTAPHGESYHYSLGDGSIAEVIPLTEGDGEYEIGVYKHVEGSNYDTVLKIKVDVELEDKFAPFINPNQFVNFTKDSELVALAAELTRNADTTDEKIAAIYEYVVKNFTYDYDLAATVKSGYLPNLDEVLEKKEGICFDYSALVTAMLRSQGIPARLEIGYHGDQYHAWISKYCEDNGWIDNKYHYDGDEWTRMDPTEESTEHHAHTSRQQARDDDTYRLMYNY